MPALSQNLTFTINSATSVSVTYPNGETNTITYYSDPTKGAGYFGSPGGLHTVAYSLSDEFLGTITMQATLAASPDSNDWFTLSATSSTINTVNGSPVVNIHNFLGNYVWVRGKLDIDQGTLLSIKYNY